MYEILEANEWMYIELYRYRIYPCYTFRMIHVITYKYIVLSIACRRHFVQRRRRLLPQRPSTPRSFYRRELTTKETWHQKILHQTYVPPSTSRELFHRSGWQSSARRQVRAQCHIIAVLSLPPAQVCWARLDADPRQQDTTQHHTACGAHKNQNLTICGEKITKSVLTLHVDLSTDTVEVRFSISIAILLFPHR